MTGEATDAAVVPVSSPADGEDRFNPLVPGIGVAADLL
jgi:hypothetical protein